jgi:formylglycine-generating enzyme required for sulfatase activity
MKRRGSRALLASLFLLALFLSEGFAAAVAKTHMALVIADRSSNEMKNKPLGEHFDYQQYDFHFPSRVGLVSPSEEVRPTPPPARCDGIATTFGHKLRCVHPGAGKAEQFKDCSDCPELVIVPAGEFTMGSAKNELQRTAEREDQDAVTIAEPFAAGRFAVTRGEFAAFVTATGYKMDGGCIAYVGSGWKLQSNLDWRSPGFVQDDRHPVTCINWNDAEAYVAWLTSKTGKAYRLLSDAEREYVARAGTTTPFWWGATISPQQANYDASYTYAGGFNGEWRKATVPVDTFASNPWGLHNVHGNVWEWTEDCWNDSNIGNPGNGKARSTGDCSLRVVRGGSWIAYPWDLRSAGRVGDNPDVRYNDIGLRVARTL